MVQPEKLAGFLLVFSFVFAYSNVYMYLYNVLHA